MNNLGKFYTKDLFSTLLISQFDIESPSKVVDLGVGGGSLLKAASQRWMDADFYAADIDDESIKKICEELPFVNIYKINSLSNGLEKQLEIKINSIDVAVCNPPYVRIKKEVKYLSILKEAALNECINLSQITSDILFLAQNLRLLKPKGELGIILPDSLITGHDFQLFRKSLLSNHRIKSIIELPEKIFPRTEARTHIIIIEKNSFSFEEINLFVANKEGICYDKIKVPSSQLEKRMDYSFHKYQQKKRTANYRTLSFFGAEIKRGQLTHAELKKKSRCYVHTTNFKNKNIFEVGNDVFDCDAKYTHATKNDILLARVGRGCIGKVSLIKDGNILISDCVYRIRVPEENLNLVWEAFLSSEGQSWLQAIAHGVCARVISKKDLLQFPVKLF